MKTAYYPTPFGCVAIGCEDEAVVYLKRVAEQPTPHEPTPLSEEVYRQLCAYFTGERQAFDFPCRPKGTPFQQAVWQALMTIPYGEVRTYSDIARQIGHPSACRAVGSANRQNPIWLAIPCHRCVGKNGTLTGYAGGLAMKEALLALESKFYHNQEGK